MKKLILTLLMAIGLCAMCFADENHDERLIGKWELDRSYVKSRHGSNDVAIAPYTMEIHEDGTITITATGLLNGVVTTKDYTWSTKVEKNKNLFICKKNSDTPSYVFNEDGELELLSPKKAGTYTEVYRKVE